jgi:hypothetical protein
MRAIASDQPVRFDDFLLGIRLPQYRRDATSVLLEAQDFRLPLRFDTEPAQMLFEQPFRIGLRQHQRIRIRAVDTGEVDVTYGLPARDDICGVDLVSRRHEVAGTPGAIEQFQGAAPENDCLRLVCPLRRLIDDAHRDAVTGQLRRHRQSDRTCAYDQYFLFHDFLPQ